MSDVQDKLCALLIACKSRIRNAYAIKDYAEQDLLNWMTENGERSIEYRGYQIKRVTPRPKKIVGVSPSIRRMQRYEAVRFEQGPPPDYLEVKCIS